MRGRKRKEGLIEARVKDMKYMVRYFGGRERKEEERDGRRG